MWGLWTWFCLCYTPQWEFFWQIKWRRDVGDVKTRVNTQTPFKNFWTAKNFHGSAFSLHATARNRKVFELQTVLQSMENLHVPSKRVAQLKNSSGPVAFSLCGPCKEHTEKEVSRKNNEGKGYGVRAVGTPVMVLFNKSSFWILPA